MTNNNIVSQDVQSKLLAVDTVKIVLSKDSYTVKNPKYFKKNGTVFTRTATKNEKKEGLYRPRVTINDSTGYCAIEYSLPKLIKGNNLEELTITDFPTVISVLQLHLKDYGILVADDDLRLADLYRVDLGKNIDFTHLCSIPEALDKINRCIGFGRQATYQIQYQNGGLSLRLQKAAMDLLLYDKIHSYELSGVSEKLSIEKDTYCQKSLCEMMAANGKNILRMERRYITRRAVKQLFAVYGIKMPKLEDICNSQIGRNVIICDWQALLNACIFPMQTEGKNLLGQVIDFLKMDKCKTLGPALSYVLLQTLLNEYSVKDLKKRFSPYVRPSTLNNWFAKIHQFACEKEVKPQILEEITRQITQWQPFCLSIDSHDEELL